MDLSFCLKAALVKDILIKAGFTELSWATEMLMREGEKRKLSLS